MEMIASIFGFLGVFLILKTGGIDFKSLFYLGIGVLSGISLAFSQIFLHRSAQTDDNLSIMTYTYLYGSILSAFLSICFYEDELRRSIDIEPNCTIIFDFNGGR